MSNYKRLFLDGHYYFFTVVTYQRNPLLIENIDLLKQSFKYVKDKYIFDVNAIVILPDHFHMILKIKNVKDYPKIIGTIKRYFSKHCPEKYYTHLTQSQSREQQNYKPIWQKRYFEHTIRDERDYNIRMNYIHYNPVKHGLVGSPKDWKHSSFDKFIKKGIYHEDWADFDSTVSFE